MTIKTALLASAAAALLTAAPALAQDMTSPAQTPATGAPAAAAQPASLTLTPGATVSGPDGELGKLEGVQANAEGQQELTVRGADGQVRAVPLGGIRQDGANVMVAYTKAEYDAAAPIAGAASPAPAATPAPAASPAPSTTDPMAPTTPMSEPGGEPAEPTTTNPTEPQS